MAISNGATLSGLKGRYIEVRVGLVRDDASKQPVLYDLTLVGTSSSFAASGFLDDSIAFETDDAWFVADVIGAEPLIYQWYVQYPWTNQFNLLNGETNSTLVVTNVDSWLDGMIVAAHVTSANGETLWLGPAELFVIPLPIAIPRSGSSGVASRYPATMNVFDQPTNFNRVSVSVTLWGLNHNRSADVSVLLVSPSGKQIMLMSNVGGNNSVSGAVLLFQQGYSPPSQSAAIPSGGPWPYGPSNYGQISQMPQVGTDPPPTHTGAYTANLDDLQYDDPNGLWKLYIYDWVQGASGNLSDSWEVRLKFQ